MQYFFLADNLYLLSFLSIGFLPVRLWDILDILIVAYLMYQLYKLLRGSIAFNILIGLLTMYVIWFLVNELNMDLLEAVLRQFVNVGVIILIIIFQPEVRRFLLFLGNTTLRQRSNFLRRILDRNMESSEPRRDQIRNLKTAMLRMSRRKTGALIVLARNFSMEGIINSGVTLDAQISVPLLESIFNKESPLHDGAVIVDRGEIVKASCILPVSENEDIPKSLGLRHRAAVGITEKTKVAAFVVSEETGRIAFAFEGKITQKLNEEQLQSLLRKYYD